METTLSEQQPHRAPAARAASPFVARCRSALSRAWPALAAYLTVRLLGVTVLVVWALATDRDPVRALAHADSDWYLRIAEHGYTGPYHPKDLAFFPLYPGLVALLEPVSPFGFPGTGLVVGWLGALAAAWALFAIGDHLYGRRAGILLAALWGCLPHAVIQSMAYTEGLFTALCGWALYALLTRRWLVAGGLTLFAGLTRPTATALIGVVGLAALIALVRRRDGWRPLAALVVAPLGWLGYLLWVASETGRLDGWFHIQNTLWTMSYDGGGYTLETGYRYLSRPAELDLDNLTFYVVGVVLIAAVALFGWSVRQRQPWPLWLFSGVLLATTIGADGYFHAKARFLLPAFALLLPPAAALARGNRVVAWLVVGVLAIAAAVFGGYLLLVWRWSP